MMNEAKPFASLGPTLLARKGGARPAMRPQLSPLLTGAQTALAEDGDELDDLGWNDMGDPDEDDGEKRVIPIGLSPIGANDEDDDAYTDEGEFDAEPALGAHAFEDEEPEGEDFDAAPVAPVHALPDEEPEEEEADYAGLPVEPSLPEPDYAAAAREPAAEPEILQRRSPSASVRAEPRRSAIDDGRRAAFTLRLDARRHLKLRLASTIKNRSAQQLVTQALDKFLAEIPEIEALAARVTRD